MNDDGTSEDWSSAHNNRDSVRESQDSHHGSELIVVLVCVFVAIMPLWLFNDSSSNKSHEHKVVRPPSLSELVSKRIDQTTKITGGLVQGKEGFTRVRNQVRLTVTLGSCTRKAFVVVSQKPRSLSDVGPVRIRLSDRPNGITVTSRKLLLEILKSSKDRRCLPS